MIVSDLLSILKQAPAGTLDHVQLDFSKNLEQYSVLLKEARKSHTPLQAVESHLYIGQIRSFECLVADAATAEQLNEDGRVHVVKARELCDRFPGQTTGMIEEVDHVSNMLDGLVFSSPLANDARREVLALMGWELSGSGQWFCCEKNHPFTVGECDVSVQLPDCPQCGAPIIAQHNQLEQKSNHVNGVEEEFQKMAL